MRGKTLKTGAAKGHFCHVRFLWRFDFKRFLRLCLFIFKRRFFFRLPMVICEGATVLTPPVSVKLNLRPGGAPAPFYAKTGAVGTAVNPPVLSPSAAVA